MEMKKHQTFEWILFLVLLGGITTVLIFLTEHSRMAALCVTWVPIVIAGTYLLGKRAGRNE